MPPKKEPARSRTPRIRAFRNLPASKPPDPDPEDEDDEEDPLQETSRSTKPPTLILTANAAASRERERKKLEQQAEVAEDKSTDTTPASKSDTASSKKKTQSKKQAATCSSTSDDVKPAKKKPKPAKDKQTPSTSGVTKPAPAKSKASKVKYPKSAQPQQPAGKPKSDRETKKTLTKSGKPATSKKTVGIQPPDHESASETAAPEEEADYFASSDEDNRQEQIEMDEAMARALAEDADDSPIELDWTRRKWTPSEDEAIIEHVKSNQIYYNMRRTDFKERATKDYMWKPLEKRFKVPGTLMWKRFCGLRSHYNKVRKRKSGQGAPQKTDREQWLSDKMQFIRKFSKPDPGMGIGDLAQPKKDKHRSSSSSTESTSSSEEDNQPKRSRKKKFNVDKVIQSVVRDKAKDKVIGQKIKDLIHGRDAASTSKQSYGYWLATLMPHISDKRFLQYAVDLMHHTIREVNASQAEAEQSRQRSASAPPPTVRPSPPSQPDELPLNLTTPPRKRSKSSQPTGIYGGNSSYATNQTPPSPGNIYPTSHGNENLNSSSQRSVDPNYGVFQVPQRPAPTATQSYAQLQATQHQSSQAEVYGPDRQLQHSNLVPGNVAPRYLPSSFGHPSGASTTTDPNGKVYHDLQPAQLSNIELIPSAASWQTPGPPPPSAVPQVSPTATMEANLEILGQHIQQATSRLVRVKKEKPETTVTADVHAENSRESDDEDNVDSSPN